MKYIPFFGCMMTTKYPHFENAVRRTVENIGLELIDIEGFTCCPDPIYFQARDKMKWYAIAARNICLAEEAGYDIITTCSGCTATLSEVNHVLKKDAELRNKVNEKLARIDKEYRGTINIRHAVTVIRDDFGYDKVQESVEYPLEGLKVAVHYGCHLLKPSHIMRVDDPDHPTILENLIRAIGAEPIHHRKTLLCCGRACFTDAIPQSMVTDIFDSILEQDADCMGLICPTCFDEFDMGQVLLNRKLKTSYNIPVVYYFQLLGLAQGLTPEEVGLTQHKIKVDPVLNKIMQPA